MISLTLDLSDFLRNFLVEHHRDGVLQAVKGVSNLSVAQAVVVTLEVLADPVFLLVEL
jgi:hypothetical protein